MRTIGRFSVRETLEELIKPAIVALLIVDLQNDFCHADGKYAQAGKDLLSINDMLPRAVQLIRHAQDLGIRCIFVRQITLPNGASDSPAWIRFKIRDGKAADYALQGSWGAEFVCGLKPAQNDLIVEKLRPDAFHNTALDRLLRSNGVESVVTLGVLTEGCVESTVRAASYHDYYSIVVEDCVASPNRARHEGSVNLFRERYTLINSNELLRCWRSQVNGQ